MTKKRTDAEIEAWNDEQVRIDDANEAKNHAIGLKLASDPSYLKILSRKPFCNPDGTPVEQTITLTDEEAAAFNDAIERVERSVAHKKGIIPMSDKDEIKINSTLTEGALLNAIKEALKQPRSLSKAEAIEPLTRLISLGVPTEKYLITKTGELVVTKIKPFGRPPKGGVRAKLYRDRFGKRSVRRALHYQLFRAPLTREKAKQERRKVGAPNRDLVRDAVKGCIAINKNPTALNVLEWIWENKDKELSLSYLAELIKDAKSDLKSN